MGKGKWVGGVVRISTGAGVSHYKGGLALS